MTTPEIVYLIIYIVFMAICGTYVFRVSAREKANKKLGRPPANPAQGIAIVTEEREHPHGTGPNEATHH